MTLLPSRVPAGWNRFLLHMPDSLNTFSFFYHLADIFIPHAYGEVLFSVESVSLMSVTFEHFNAESSVDSGRPVSVII